MLSHGLVEEFEAQTDQRGDKRKTPDGDASKPRREASGTPILPTPWPVTPSPQHHEEIQRVLKQGQFDMVFWLNDGVKVID